MAGIPRDESLDGTLALLSNGYTFISDRCRRYGSDIFETRLMLRKAVCIMGEDAARIFYEPDRFTRKGAMPQTTLRLLQDKGSVQQLDGEAHRWRKRMFMSLMTPDAIRHLADLTDREWRARAAEWQAMDRVVLLDEVRGILCRAVCAWAGVPLSADEVGRSTREFGAMIDEAGTVGPRNLWGLMLRGRSERWIRGIVDAIRAGDLAVREGSAADIIARHRDPDGNLLDTTVAAVELINVLRPTVAVARFVMFAALALHDHPGSRRKLQAGDEDHLDLFVQEVRRFYPFFPIIGGRVRNEFDWRGHRFAKGDWVLLDLYGTNHDPRIWPEPDTFQPERFRRWDGSAYDFVPQGAGDHHRGHRCPGEWITIEIMKQAVRLLTTAMHYDVPEQDLRIDLSQMPAKPKSGFVIGNVRLVGEVDV